MRFALFIGFVLFVGCGYTPKPQPVISKMETTQPTPRPKPTPFYSPPNKYYNTGCYEGSTSMACNLKRAKENIRKIDLESGKMLREFTNCCGY